MIRLALRVRREHAELALADLLDFSPGGVEEIDDDEETVEYAVYGAPGELPELPALHAAIGGALVEVHTSEVAEDWQERWKRFHRPVLIAPSTGGGGPALRVRPPWERAAGGDGLVEIAIDPGQAFGTGSHATTRLCLELLLSLASQCPGGSLIDVGTGSGVLAIAAAKLGFHPVIAYDHDPASLEAASQNAAANGVTIDLARHDLRAAPLPGAGSATVLANLLRPLLLDLVDALSWTPAQVIAGGLLAGEADEVAEAFAAAHGLRERARRQEGEWAALWLAREALADEEPRRRRALR